MRILSLTLGPFLRLITIFGWIHSPVVHIPRGG